MSDCTYILSWDMYGLESIINITEIEHNRVLDILSDNKTKSNLAQSLNSLVLRAQFNPQRHYEIYAVTVNNDVTKQDLITMFKDTPQEMADLVRSRGHKLYSDRITKSEKNEIVIT